MHCTDLSHVLHSDAGLFAELNRRTGRFKTQDQLIERRMMKNEKRPPPLVDSHGNSRWTMEKILAHEDRRDYSSQYKCQILTRYYRVRWLGYSSRHDSWEPSPSLMNPSVPDVVREYESGLELQQRAQALRPSCIAAELHGASSLIS